MKVLSIAALVLMAALVPQSFTGTLEASDPIWEGVRHYDEYSITVEPMQQVTVRMTSSEFDTYLIVRSASGTTHTNDDFEGTMVSQVDFVAREGGEWSVLASGFGSEAFGDYSVEVTLGAIAEVETISGRLDPSDTESIKGEYYDTHTIRIADDRPFTLALEGFGFDGYLVARSPGGATTRDDDGMGGGNARLGPLTGAGEWTVFVTSSFAGAVGAYDLSVIR